MLSPALALLLLLLVLCPSAGSSQQQQRPAVDDQPAAATSMQACKRGFHRCGTRCVANSSPKLCGGRCITKACASANSCVVCAAPAGIANAVAACAANKCSWRCSSGFLKSKNQCLAVPKPPPPPVPSPPPPPPPPAELRRNTGLSRVNRFFKATDPSRQLMRYTGLSQRGQAVRDFGKGGRGGGGGGSRGGRGSRGLPADLRAAACNGTSSSSSCTDYGEVLLLALTPPAYSSNNTADTGGFSFIAPSRDQGQCASDVCFVATAAAEAAIATKLRQDWSLVGLSEQDLCFCRMEPDSAGMCDAGSSYNTLFTQIADQRLARWALRLDFPYQPDRAGSRCSFAATLPSALPAGGFLAVVEEGNTLETFARIKQRIMLNGGVMASMVVWPDFEAFRPSPGADVYNSSRTDFDAPDSGFHAVFCYGWSDAGAYWLCKDSYGPDIPDSGGSFKIAYGAAFIAAADYTYALEFRWNDDVAAIKASKTLERLRNNSVPDTEERLCVIYTPPDPTRLLFLAEELADVWAWFVTQPQGSTLKRPRKADITEDLVLSNLGTVTDQEGDKASVAAESLLTALSKPGDAFRICTAARGLVEVCEKLANCASCQRVPGCSWCFDARDASPRCQLAGIDSSTCLGQVRSLAECPTDGVVGAGEGTLKCSDLGNCRECLKFAGQCRWCLGGSPDGYSGCQAGSAPCSGWFGSSRRECPADGDPLAGDQHTSPCAGLGTCELCMRYGGRKPQCVWCSGENKCVHAASDEAAACRDGGQPVIFTGGSQCSIPADQQPVCPAGQQPAPAAGSSACSVCPADTWKSAAGSFPCTACPQDTVTTGGTAADRDSLADCSADTGCAGGKQRVDGRCQVCPSNTIQPAPSSQRCLLCPSGTFTTGGSAADHDNITDCSPKECPPGTQPELGGTCATCPDNTFKATPSAGPCKPCPSYTEAYGSRPEQHDEQADCRPVKPCFNKTDCYSCHQQEGCFWCFEGLPDRSNDKPRCLVSGQQCLRAISSISQCPVDGIADATASTVTCQALGNCRECLRHTYQCRWCVTDPPDGISGCQHSGQCGAWYGYSPRECPADGDPGAIASWTRCADMNACSSCLMYGGLNPQCVWCADPSGVGGRCLAGADAGQCGAGLLLTKGSSVCPAT